MLFLKVITFLAGVVLTIAGLGALIAAVNALLHPAGGGFELLGSPFLILFGVLILFLGLVLVAISFKETKGKDGNLFFKGLRVLFPGIGLLILYLYGPGLIRKIFSPRAPELNSGVKRVWFSEEGAYVHAMLVNSRCHFTWSVVDLKFIKEDCPPYKKRGHAIRTGKLPNPVYVSSNGSSSEFTSADSDNPFGGIPIGENSYGTLLASFDHSHVASWDKWQKIKNTPE